jgi:hypothetical protein
MTFQWFICCTFSLLSEESWLGRYFWSSKCSSIFRHAFVLESGGHLGLRSGFNSMRIGRLKLIVLLLPMMTGCLRHTRVSQQPEFSAPVPSPNVLQLVETINRRYDQIPSLSAKLEVAVTVGGTHPGEVTDYAPCLGSLCSENHMDSAF